jgi:predicted phosphodiesterase/uncharacterized Fe-S cluster-containing radical SAM superfamily protein
MDQIPALPVLAFDTPILLFGGPYSNLEATRAVLAEARQRGIPLANVICTGDVVAYGADAAETVGLVRAAGIRVVMGNCEEQLAAGGEDCGCGFAPGSACERLSAAWYAHADAQLDDDARLWMAGLPRRLDLAMNGLRLAVVHGSLSEINRFVFASTPARVKALDIATAGVDGIIGGHSGLPFTHVTGGRLWHNPGVVGMPANDRTPRVWFSIISPGEEPRMLAIEHVPLTYDHPAAAAKMSAAGLPDGYAEALASGLWPSCDVLPPPELKQAGRALSPGMVVWRADESGETMWPPRAAAARLDPAKFGDPAITANGESRARVRLAALDTLWINTGTLCNLACENCYIESTPRNDRLAYISADEVAAYLDEIGREGWPTRTIGFTGGEPFMNPDFMTMLADALTRGHEALVLTNAMKPLWHKRAALAALHARHGERLTIRVSIDHYTRELHELERGPRSWQPTIDGLVWLSRHGFRLNVAGRLYSGEAEGIVRAGYQRLFAEHGIALDAHDPVALTLFPEMDDKADVPEITESCWGILGKSPADVMCASSRMVVKRKGADRPAVLACTLLAYDPQFELGNTLAEASGAVALNHPHCATFCVLGGAACSK